MEKTIKLDLDKIEAKDLNGQVYQIDAKKNIGNILFVQAHNIELDTLARKIHSGEIVEVTAEELEFISKAIAQSGFYLPFITRLIVKHLNDLASKL